MYEDNKKKVLLIGNKNEFLIRRVYTELEEEYEVIISNPTINEVEEESKGIRVFLLFIDSADVIKDLLIYLKDISVDKCFGIVLVGEKLEIQEAVKYLGKENIGLMFSRPVDSKQISEGLRQLVVKTEQKNERKHILLIDDDPEYLRRTQRVLHNHYKVYLANSAMSGFMLLSKHKIDLILMDYLMPVINGTKMIQALKLEPETANIPVISVTNMTDTRTTMELIQAGSENCISKEIAASNLVTVVADFFAKQDWENSAYKI